MTKIYFVVDTYGKALEFAKDPWGDGDCLVDNLPKSFTAFYSRSGAKEALSISKKYAKNDSINELETIWEIKKWKIISADVDYDYFGE